MFRDKSFSLPKVVQLAIAVVIGMWINDPLKAQILSPTQDRPNNSNSRIEEQIVIDRIRFVGNTVFDDRSLLEVVDSIKGKEATSIELLQIKTLISEFYQSKGYFNTAVTIPNQEFADGTIVIKVAEGSLSAIEVNGIDSVQLGFITRRLPDVGSPLNIEQLEQSLARLRDNDVIENIDARLEEAEPGNSLLILDVTESKPFNSQFTLTNSFSPSVGSFGGNADISYNLLGYGDTLDLGYTRTESNGLERFSAGYSLPVNRHDTTLNFNYTTADTNIIEEPISALDIQADYESYLLGVTQPVARSQSSSLNLGIDLEQIESESFFQGDSNPFVEGLDDGESQLTALRLGAEYATQNDSSSLAVSSVFSLGLDVFDPTVTEVGRDGLFWSWQGQGQWLRRLAGLLLVTNLNVQLSPDQLLPVEQLSLGGRNNVRGYRQNLSLGDNGIIGSVGVEIPLVESRDQNLRLVPFVDVGTIWSNSNEEIENDTLVSTGLGLRYTLGTTVSAQLDLGFPLIEAIAPEDFSTDQEFTFLLQVNP